MGWPVFLKLQKYVNVTTKTVFFLLNYIACAFLDAVFAFFAILFAHGFQKLKHLAMFF